MLCFTQIEERKRNNEGLRSMISKGEQTEEEEKFSAVLYEIAQEHGLESVTTIALACECLAHSIVP